ncbi:MAG: hypothetical protein ACI39U_04455 [Candidatus Cryptobacteroides sp.]
MKKHLLIFIASVLCLSCGTGTEKSSVRQERVSFELMLKAPVVVYPDDNVSYRFNISHTSGISSVCTFLENEPIQGTQKDFPDLPEKVEYSFVYTMDPDQIGQTVDFVFKVECGDGTTDSVDYPVYVRSVSETVDVVLPESLPSEAIVGDLLEFDILVSTGYPLSRIRTLKDGLELPELTKTTGFEEMKSDLYRFSYVLPVSDGGKTVPFIFEASDTHGNFGMAEYSVKVRKGVPKVLYTEIFDTSMKISNTSEKDTEAGGVTGNNATEFVPATIPRYNGDDSEFTEGVKGGLTVYSGDVSEISYSSDGVDICLSKYSYSAMSAISGTYVWARKAKNGWLLIDGIRLHACTDLTLSFKQCGGSVKAEWSVDGENWTQICTNGTTGECSENFTVPDGTETMEIRFTENGGTAHLRFDDITLKGE